ncbi:MAG TPA: sugar phosphate isomerase/epimerase [Solirubrobacteraceae bacterium]|nr:sugar phosphate isomerase/epimerase [Solirubrobacteraceae bacterium]
MHERVELGTGPVSFGVDFADAPDNPAWTHVLDGIAEAGYRWTELGPIGYLPDEIGPELAARGLGLTAGFVFEPLHDPARHAETAIVARAVAQRVAQAGGRFLVVIDAVTPERARTAGRRALARRLDRHGVTVLRRIVRELAAIARGSALRPVVHPHAGTYIEFDDEVEPLLDWAELCLDTGHCLYAGQDPVRAYERWADRIPYLHLKDLDLGRLDGDFWGSVRAGAFRPLGDGDLDVPAFFAALERRGFAGWAIVEQDRVPGGNPVGDLVASRRYLERLR